MNNYQDIIPRINSHLNVLKPAEKKVAEYITTNTEQVIHMSITKLAKEAGVSEATIVKFCQNIGYSGYQELKIRLAQAGESRQAEHIYGKIEAGDDISVITKAIFQIYDRSFQNTEKLLHNSDIGKAVQLILKADSLHFFGFGASGVVARDAELKFKRINFRAEASVDNHTQKTLAALLTDRDVVVAISDSGRTKELVNSVSVAREAGAGIIAITSNMGSPITELADISLFTSSEETPFRGSALASRMAQLSVIDVLFLGTATTRFEDTEQALKKTRIVMQENKID